MNDEFLSLYDELDINNKRNEFSNLLFKTEKLLDQLIDEATLKKLSTVKNYDVKEHAEMLESDILTFFYEDLWIIKNKVLSLLIKNSSVNNK